MVMVLASVDMVMGKLPNLSLPCLIIAPLLVTLEVFRFVFRFYLTICVCLSMFFLVVTAVIMAVVMDTVC